MQGNISGCFFLNTVYLSVNCKLIPFTSGVDMEIVYHDVRQLPHHRESWLLTSSARYGQLNRSECGGAHADVHVVHVKKSKRRR